MLQKRIRIVAVMSVAALLSCGGAQHAMRATRGPQPKTQPKPPQQPERPQARQNTTKAAQQSSGEPKSDADCRKSDVCAVEGLCSFSASKGYCVAKSDADCLRSEDCQTGLLSTGNKGRCHARDGMCVSLVPAEERPDGAVLAYLLRVAKVHGRATWATWVKRHNLYTFEGRTPGKGYVITVRDAYGTGVVRLAEVSVNVQTGEVMAKDMVAGQWRSVYKPTRFVGLAATVVQASSRMRIGERKPPATFSPRRPKARGSDRPKVINNIASWRHPVRRTFGAFGAKLSRVVLTKFRTYPTFHLSLPRLSDTRADRARLRALYHKVCRANAGWSYSVVDSTHSVTTSVLCSRTRAVGGRGLGW